MEPRSTCARHPARAPRGAALLAAVLLVLPLTATPTGSYAAAPPAAGTPEQDRLAEAERQALADLAESSAQVRQAAVELSAVAAQLPGARSDVARARGGLAGARAKLAAANAELERAEQDRSAAAAQVSAADERVQQGREDVGLLARHTYQRGRLGGVRDVMEAGEPQDVLVRAAMLRQVFQHQDATLDRLGTARLALARREAGLAAQEREVARARERAREREERAREISEQAEAAAARVAALLQARSAALTSAEGARAADEAEYAQAQEASRALAERIREAARRAAEEQARQAAAAKAAAEAARQAAQREAVRKAAARSAAERDRASRAARATQDAASRAERRGAAPERLAPSVSRAGMSWPCRGCPLTSSFGWRTHPIFGTRRLHAGIDMGASIGTPVRAADSGTVIIAGAASGYGTLVVISHGDGLSTAYAHMSTISVGVGQSVSRGDEVGEVGNEGNSTGPHLHFEVRRHGEPVDPMSYVGGS